MTCADDHRSGWGGLTVPGGRLNIIMHFWCFVISSLQCVNDARASPEAFAFSFAVVIVPQWCLAVVCLSLWLSHVSMSYALSLFIDDRTLWLRCECVWSMQILSGVLAWGLSIAHSFLCVLLPLFLFYPWDVHASLISVITWCVLGTCAFHRYPLSEFFIHTDGCMHPMGSFSDTLTWAFPPCLFGKGQHIHLP